jgi:hypothetical protein
MRVPIQRVFALLLPLSIAACGGNGGTFPAAVTSPSPTISSSAPFMRGTVSDTAFHNIAGATIQIVNGPSAGLTTTSDANGQWAFSGVLDDSTQFRATKEGYETAVMPLGPYCAACNPNRWVNFSLKTMAAPVNVAGFYAMTVTVACTSFPEQMRTRTYAVTLPSSANAYFDVSPTEAKFVPGWDWFQGGVSGNSIGFWFETLVEEVAPGNYFLIGVSASGNLRAEHPATITTVAAGRISYCSVDPVSGTFDECLRGRTASVTTCDSPQHTIVLTPR